MLTDEVGYYVRWQINQALFGESLIRHALGLETDLGRLSHAWGKVLLGVYTLSKPVLFFDCLDAIYMYVWL